MEKNQILNNLSTVDPEILELIPQRPPFLFVDKIIKRKDQTIFCSKKLTGDEDFFQGHFPNNPIMPGVLLQECVFQTGALLMGHMTKETNEAEKTSKLGVVSRVEKAKFKNFALPGDLLKIEVTLNEILKNAYYMRGKITVSDKIIMSINFTCSLIEGKTEK